MREWSIPYAPLCALWLLERAGFAAYIVGGCVRDTVRGVQPHDWDVTTSARPEQMKRVFGEAGYSTVLTGERHGTVCVLVGQGEAREAVECTTYRIDGAYTDARHPDGVSFTDRVADDLARRDFTVNAMAVRVRGIGEWACLPSTAWTTLDAASVELLDLFGGVEDLQSGSLRCVGEPSVRFGEDALRILRGVRFCVQLGMQPEEATLAAMKSEAAGLAKVSRERVAAELLRMLSEPDAKPSVGLRLMGEAGLWAYTLPEAAFCPSPWFASEQELLLAVDALSNDACLRLALLLLGRDEAAARAACRTLRLSNAQVERVSGAVAAAREMAVEKEPMSDVTLRKKASRLGKACEDGLWLLGVCQAELARQRENERERLVWLRERGDCLRTSDLAIDGGVLMKTLGLQGREVGQMLAYLLDVVLEHPEYNTTERLLDEAKKKRGKD